MITVNLNKMESALEQVRKAFPNLRPTDVAHLTSAIVLAGRHARARYNDREYIWPDDVEELAGELVRELLDAHGEDLSQTKKSASTDEEPIKVQLDLVPNVDAAAKQLEGRDDLLALLSDALQEGLEFNFQSHDVGWQWALDHVNWRTISGGQISRKVRIRTLFSGGASGVEMGSVSTRQRASKKSK
ncbi:MAG: hypothetical protein N2109_01505 [Fimbriimonadales bacterium]|nr:hypothetical protein [Fimbriimonadales bacterium]